MLEIDFRAGEGRGGDGVSAALHCAALRSVELYYVRCKRVE